MNPSKEKLRHLDENLSARKQSTENKIRFLNNEIKAMEAQEKGLLRKQRNRRIFTRGGMLEAFLLQQLLSCCQAAC